MSRSSFRSTQEQSNPLRWVLEVLEARLQLSAAFDLTDLTQLRADSQYAQIDGLGIGVAVLDTGLYASHPLLAPNFRAWYDATPESSSVAVDPHGHGTHVAGTIAASSAGIGVAPRASLIGVRVLGSDGHSSGEYDTVAAGLRWVLEHREEHNIRVVNMSLGNHTNTNDPSLFSNVLQTQYIRELERVGITVVTASGNSYGDFVAPGAAFPAVVSTINVGSVWEDAGVGDKFPSLSSGYVVDFTATAGSVSSFSQRSLLPNQVFAPGQTIYSTWNNAGGNLYNTIAGTSMAAPFVSGLVALMQDAASTFGGRYLQPSEVLSVLRDTAEFVVDSNNTGNRIVDPVTGALSDLPETGQVFRRVNALNAVSRVRELVRGGQNAATNADLNKSTATAVSLGVLRGGASLGFIGAIDQDGRNTPGSKDIDFYKVDVTGGGQLTVTLTPLPGGRGMDPRVKIYNSAGQLIIDRDDSGDLLYPTVTLNNQPAGTYFVAVAGYQNGNFDINGNGSVPGSMGDYQLSVSLVALDPNGTLDVAELISLPVLESTQQRVIGLDESVTVGVGDVDMYRFTPTDDGELRVAIVSDHFGSNAAITRLQLRSANGQVLATATRVLGTFSFDYTLYHPVVRGQTYYLVLSGEDAVVPSVTSPFQRSGNSEDVGYYQLVAVLDNRDDDGSALKLILNGVPATPTSGSVTAAIGSDPARGTIGRDGRYDVDFYKFVVPSSGLLDLSITGQAGFTPNLRVWRYDAVAEDLYEVGELPNGESRFVLSAVPGDEYYVGVSAKDNQGYEWWAVATGTGGTTGSYVLTPRFLSNNVRSSLWDNTIAGGKVRSIVAAQGVAGTIGRDAGLVIGPSDIDLYRFVPDATGMYSVRVTAGGIDGFDTAVRIFNANGQEIAWNDDADGTTTDSLASVTLTAGVTYYIGISSWSPQYRAYNAVNGSGAAGLSDGEYSLMVRYSAPRIRLSGQGVAIAHLDASPSSVDWTNFNGVPIENFVKTRIFAITNDGNAPIVFSWPQAPIRITGSHAANFVIVNQPPATLAPGQTFKFHVKLDTTALGFHHAKIRIATNDPSTPVFEFSVRGAGVRASKLVVSGGQTPIAIAAGDTVPTSADWTAFGNVPFGTTRIRMYRLTNTGQVSVTVNNIKLTGSSLFGVVGAKSFVIGVGQTATFQVAFTSSLAGPASTTVRIVSNDFWNPNYRFAVNAVGA